MTTSQRPVLARERLLRDYEEVRATTMRLCAPLEPEDMVVQTMPDVSPTKWHLAHTTWFFETFVLGRTGSSYARFDERFHTLFNSYYKSMGDPFPRSRRGQISRPTVEDVVAYRRHVDAAMEELLNEGEDAIVDRFAAAITVGLHHEQQHQELLLMDIKHVFAQNPIRPEYQPRLQGGHPNVPVAEPPTAWRRFAGGTVEVGFYGRGFCYDNESPRHSVILEPFELAARPVTTGAFMEFIADGGYDRPEFWLADGWELVRTEAWRAPLYWEQAAGGWWHMTLDGYRPVDPAEPVCHISYFEADAFASWSGVRLPTECEWEHAASGEDSEPRDGTFLESGLLHPRRLPGAEDAAGPGLSRMFGDVWEWTASPYTAYPGFRRFEGALGEYNGKFMSNQMVLRGGCCVTPARHIRPTYRNFYYPHQRWMFAGLRLAR